MNQQEEEDPQILEVEHDPLEELAKEERGEGSGFHRRRSSSFMKSGFATLVHNEQEEEELDSFFNQDKHGDVYSISPIIATLYAIVSKVQTFQFDKRREQKHSIGKGESRPSSQSLTSTDFNTPDFIDLDEVNATSLLGITSNNNQKMKIAFIHKGNSLIYLALSRNKGESVQFLRKQLEFLHCQLISITTQDVVKALKLNPSYDVQNDIGAQSKLLKNFSKDMQYNPATFLNSYLPLRIHYKTREIIEEIVRRLKPISEGFYYGLILAQNSVVCVIRNNPKIMIIPSGMTEGFRLKVFIHMEQGSSLKSVFICEDQSPALLNELESSSDKIFREFENKKITEVLEHCEKKMSMKSSNKNCLTPQNIDMKEVITLLIQNTHLEQFTFYNYPFLTPDQLTKENLNCIYEFETLHNQYLAGKKKKDIFVKKKYALYTYVIHSFEEWVIMAEIAHNRTNFEADEIVDSIIQDTQIEETSCFISRTY